MEPIKKWEEELREVSRPEKKQILSSFFKSGKGEYGEGDVFLGINVGDNRSISQKYSTLSFNELGEMLSNEIHEFRLAALLALIKKSAKSDEATNKGIVNFYLSNTQYINNWDLVDLSAPQIIGQYQLKHPEADLTTPLSNSENMWERRIAIVSTLTLIRANKLDTALQLAEKYLSAKEDLIHKATGWILREVGKKDLEALRQFLNKNVKKMPRTALHYSIERMDKEERQHYIKL